MTVGPSQQQLSFFSCYLRINMLPDCRHLHSQYYLSWHMAPLVVSLRHYWASHASTPTHSHRHSSPKPTNYNFLSSSDIHLRRRFIRYRVHTVCPKHVAILCLIRIRVTVIRGRFFNILSPVEIQENFLCIYNTWDISTSPALRCYYTLQKFHKMLPKFRRAAFDDHS